MDNISLIQGTGLFDKLSQDKLEKLLSNIDEVTYPKSEIFIDEGEHADACYVIKAGACQVFTKNDEGQEVILARLDEGNYFGEQALLTENPGKRNASIRAIKNITLLKIDHATFRDILEFDQALKEKLEKIGHEQLLVKLQAQSAKFNLHKDLIGDLDQYEHWNYESDDVILQAGAPSDGALFVVSGSVDVVVQEDDGTEQLISTVSAGNLIGELGVMTHQPRKASAIANGPVVIAFIPNEKFKQLHDSNEDLQNMVSALRHSYQTAKRGRVIQYVGEFMEMNSITTTFRMPDGRQIFTARVIGKSIQSIRHMDMSECDTLIYEDGEELTRELMVKDNLLMGATVFGEWDNISHIFRMVFDQEPISPENIEQFKKTGDFETSDISYSGEDSDIVCECMWVNQGKIRNCMNQGMNLEQITDETGCGSVCASCLPTIQNMLGHDIWQPVRIDGIKQLTDDTRSYILVGAKDQPLPDFKPGQYILIQSEIDGDKIERAYTLTSASNDTTHYEVAVKKEDNGLFSSWLFNQAYNAPVLRVSSPQGSHFIYETDHNTPSVCFAAGIGITPILSFARTLHSEHKQRPLVIHYSVDSVDDLVYDQELNRLSDDANIEVIRHISSEHDRLSESDIQALVERYPDAEYFVCGPSSYEELVVKALKSNQVTEKHIHVERFTSATEGAA